MFHRERAATPRPAARPAPRSRRTGPELDAELRRIREKLQAVETKIAREQDFARKMETHSNRGVVDALELHAAWIRERIRHLTDELTTGDAAAAAAAAPTRRWVEARGTDQDLAKAARRALKRGRFDNASERAVFGKIVSDLEDGGRDIQLHVLERLGELEATAAIPVFAAAARHHAENVRLAALRGVLAMRHPATRDILVDALADSSHRLRVWAVRGLYGLDDPSLDELLSHQLRDPHPAVRRACATYLSWRRTPGAEVRLLRALRDESAEVRAAVANALGQCGSDRAVFKLIVALKDDDPQVREAAATAISRLAGNVPEIDAAGDPGAQVEDLRTWWTTERVQRITATAPEVADSFDDGELPDSLEEPAVADVDGIAADTAEVGDLDAVPDMEFDSVDDGFVAPEEESAR